MTIDAGLATVIVAVVSTLGILLNTALTLRQNKNINETHKQVTVNHHSSEVPTVLDRISDVRAAVMDVRKDVNNLGSDFNAHVTHSNRMDERLVMMELARDAAHEIRLAQVESEVKKPD